jgi:hypothetical protein
MTYTSGVPQGRAGFGALLRAEWTKFRTVRGWVVGTVAGALVLLLLGLLTAFGSHAGCGPTKCEPHVPIGPGGQAVNDSFYFAHQTLDGDGSITVRVASMTGRIPSGGGPSSADSPNMATGVMPWSKVGILVKDGTSQGSVYAAVMLTGGHGVRMQYDYTHDLAGSASARWLRLTRAGDTLTGYDSVDGTRWTEIGSTRLAGLPRTVQAGLFATSPAYQRVFDQSLGGQRAVGGPTRVTGVIDHVSRQGGWSGGAWTGTDLGGGGDLGPPSLGGEFQESGGTVTLAGSGDISPAVPGAAGGGLTVESALTGVFGGLVVVVVVGALFVTAEYRRGMIRTTLIASPRRGRVLAAKAVVVGSATFAVGLVGAAVTTVWAHRIERANGNVILAVGWLTQLRVIAGTALLLALAAVVALGVGALLRRGAGAVAIVVAVVVLPYILAAANALPAGPSQWLLRLSPAAAFALQQSIPRYPQVDVNNTVADGYFPLPPWGGLLVLCAYAALALGLATLMLRRRDA